MSETLRTIQRDALLSYDNYKETFHRYCGQYSQTQRKIKKHTNTIQAIETHLSAMQKEDIRVVYTDEVSHEITTNQDIAKRELQTAQDKLAFREWEAQRNVDDAVTQSRQFHDNHRVELIRLAMIDAELDGIAINIG